MIFTGASFHLGYLRGMNVILNGAKDLKFGYARVIHSIEFPWPRKKSGPQNDH
jgi:hypothetical protein